uniref:uncharacterized protein LOC120341509 n=1 Tax=Styela clava TaxID=7725 RepID=UPI00193AD750|nr:uncharacterized protein LOC120341509 [Styela clava]
MLRFLAMIILYVGKYWMLSCCHCCELPKLEKEIDYSELTGTWYETVHPGETIYKVVSCETLQYQSGANGSFSAKWSFQKIEKSQNKSLGISNAYFARIAPSTFLATNEIGMKKIENAILQDVNDATAHKIESEMDAPKYMPIVHIVEKNAYVMVLMCDLFGMKKVYVSTSDPLPKTKTLLKIHNKLVEVGNGWADVKLNLAQCSQ